MAKQDNILVLDVGTTGIKAFVFDAGLHPLAKSYHPLSKSMPHRGWVEQSPGNILKVSIQALRDAVRLSGVSKNSLLGLAITNQRETVILWDKRTGRPVYPAIVWEDKRTAVKCRKLRRYTEEVGRKTGLPIDPYFSATKARWILDNVPRAQQLLLSGNLLFGTVDSWLLWNLLEDHPHRTDYTNASRTLLFNVRTLQWDRRLLKLFGVPQEILPEVLPSAAHFGTLKKEIIGRRLPVLAVCGDQQASLFAAGRRKDTTKVTYGTGAFVGQVIGRKFKVHKPFFTTLAAHPRRPFYALEAKVEDCGQDVQRVLPDIAALRKVLTRIAASVAVYLKKLPSAPTHIVLDGGAVRDGYLVGIQARAADIPTRRHKTYDGTALGAAMLARITAQSQKRRTRIVAAKEKFISTRAAG